jgi:hypothetical protein
MAQKGIRWIRRIQRIFPKKVSRSSLEVPKALEKSLKDCQLGEIFPTHFFLHGYDPKFKIYNFCLYINFKMFVQVVFYNESLQIFK